MGECHKETTFYFKRIDKWIWLNSIIDYDKTRIRITIVFSTCDLDNYEGDRGHTRQQRQARFAETRAFIIEIRPRARFTYL